MATADFHHGGVKAYNFVTFGFGSVDKGINPELPPRSEYKITELGLSLIPIIDQMLKWGEEHFDIF